MALVVRNLGVCSYAEALELQQEIVRRKLASGADDHLLVVEHPSVYTLGRGADVNELRGAPDRRGVPWFRVGRGGGATYHGPGQVVAYPILSLPRQRRDVRAYVRLLEEVVERVCRDFGVAARADGPHPGVWVDGKKIAAIGIGIRRWVTDHGLALNVTTDLTWFDEIIPCRVEGMQMTSLARQCRETPTQDAVVAALVRHFRAAVETPWEAHGELGVEVAR